jgi:hypothetical protein
MKTMLGVLLMGLVVHAYGQTRVANEVRVLLPLLKQPSFVRIPLRAGDFSTIANPHGSGTIVFVKSPRGAADLVLGTPPVGTAKLDWPPRKPLWIVLSKSAATHSGELLIYALNGPAKDITPAVDFPRGASDFVWKDTGMNKLEVSEAILKLTYPN